MRKTLLLLLAVCMFRISYSQSGSLLWEISGNGLTKPSYLYGTMHVSDKIAFHLTDSFFIAVKGADVIALESNPEHWIENDFGNPDLSDNYETISEDGYEYFSSYGGDFYKDASGVFVPDIRTFYSAYADNSWLINGYLYRYNDPRGDYEEETYLDLFIFQCGKKLNKQIAALEKEQEVLKLLQKAYDEPDEDDDKNKEQESADFMEQERIKAAFEDEDKSIGELIDEAYRDGNLSRLDSLEIVASPSSQYRKYFIEDRNKNMVRRMDSIMQGGQTIFTGIGAAHLPGTNGAIALLKSMGYTVRPVKGKVTNKSIKEKEKIDAIYFQQPVNQQYAYDSLFSVTAPGKMYEIGGYQTNSFLLYPDMANSAYYSIIRIAHHAYLRGWEPADVLNEIQSMLYETIPGDIQSQQLTSTNNGWPALNIISKTNRGSYLHFYIVITPLEVIVFKASGIDEFVIKSKEMQTFFNSIKFKNTNDAGWSTYAPHWNSFTVNTPNQRIAQSQSIGASVNTQGLIAMGEAAENDTRYLFFEYHMNDESFIEEDSFELVHLMQEFTDQFKKLDYKNQGYTFNTVSGHPSAESVWKGTNGYLHAKTVVNGPYYLFFASFSEENKRPDAYFNSIKLTDFTYDKPFTMYTDTSLYFSVQTIFPEPDTLLTLEEIEYGNYNGYDYGYGYYGDEEEEDIDDDYLAKNKSMAFSSEVTPEQVFVRYHKYHEYQYFDDPTVYWNSFDSNYVNNGYKISRRVFTKNDSIQTLSFLLTDTASTRGIWKKFILEDNALFQISTSIDTINPPSPFLQNFYSTFTPSDSVNGPSIFASKADQFFAALNGMDTMDKKQALKSIYVVNLEDKDAERLMMFIQSSAFKKLKMDERDQFITELGRLEHKNVLPTLKQIYIDAADSTTLQTAVLNAISNIHSPEAVKTFTELLYIETPLAQNNYSLGWMFTDLSDSIELTKKMFPQLFDFVAFPEYQFPTYRLLAELVMDDSTNVKLYQDHFRQVLTLAGAELKRSLFDDDDDEEENDNSYNRYYNHHYFSKLRDITEGEKSADKTFFGTTAYADEEGGFGDFNFDYDYEFDFNAQSIESGYTWVSTLQDYYSILMAPYYADPAVKKYFDRILRSKDKELVMNTALTMLKKGLPVPDSVFTSLQKDRKWRYDMIESLKRMGRTDKIDTAYSNQRMITEAILYQYVLKEEDSIAYIGKRLVYTEDGDGYVYFYKSKIGNDKGWNLDCTGIQPSDESKYEIQPLFVHYGDVILDDADQEEKIDEIIKKIELIGRARVEITFGDQNDFNEYDY